MTSRSRSPEKKKGPHLRELPPLDQLRSNVEAASRRLEKGNPQTPPAQRFASSTFSSPGSILGREEDAIIIELTARYLQAGIEGESNAQCRINFGPGFQRRVGDHQEWLPGYVRKQESLDRWGQTYELWRDDITGLDMGLVSDKIERNVREVYNKQLLVDAGSARLVLVLPSLVPLPVLETILSTLFERWRYPNITLLPAPTMATFAAGLRSALLVDIGWEEIVVNTVYEYREIKTYRSARAMKALTLTLAKSMQSLLLQSNTTGFRLDLEFVEELLTRAMHLPVIWDILGLSSPTEKLSGDKSVRNPNRTKKNGSEIEWRSQTSQETIHIPVQMVSEAIRNTFFEGDDDAYDDDDACPLPKLIYNALLAMSADVRAVCMSRIIFTGQPSSIEALKEKILESVKDQIRTNEWSFVKGSRARKQRAGLLELAQARTSLADARHNTAADAGKDYVEERVRKLKARQGNPVAAPVEVKEVVSLGPWTGASLLTSLKIRGFVEIERERFLSQGVAGASRDIDTNAVPAPQRMSSFGIPKTSKVQDRISWTLAGWG